LFLPLKLYNPRWEFVRGWRNPESSTTIPGLEIYSLGLMEVVNKLFLYERIGYVSGR